MKKTTTLAKNDIERNWYIVDADSQILGRLASKISERLIGKDKVTYTPHMDSGDFVIVINADKLRVTGNKFESKTYFRHSGYPGGAKTVTLERMMEKSPEEVVRKAVKGMLPKNKLGSRMITRLYIYQGDVHSHEAQKPIEIKL